MKVLTLVVESCDTTILLVYRMKNYNVMLCYDFRNQDLND